MITSNDLELKCNITLNELTSNAADIKAFVLERIKDYTPEKYQGRVEEAKNDRAVLNNAEKQLNSKRLELERQYMQPFNGFKAIIGDTCKIIREASAALDEIVKAEETREKDEKRAKIEKYWNDTGFTLVDFDDVFEPKWLNKGAKLTAVYKEIDDAQKKILDDLKVIENFPADDVPLIKTVYLTTLDITAAMAKADSLKENRERLAREEAARRETAERLQLKEQAKEERKEDKQIKTSESVAAQIAESHNEEYTPDEEKETYALVFTGTRKQLLELKKYMTEQGIAYQKLQERHDGVYVAEVSK